SGLDPVNTQVMKDTVVALRRRGKSILFSTHILEQAEKLCEQLCIIARGRKLVDGALSDIKRIHGGHHLVIGFDGSAGAAQQVFADRLLVKKVDDYGQFAELELAAGADAQVILQRLVASGARISRFELMEPSLNKIFIYLVGPEAARAVMRPEGEAARAVVARRLDGFLILTDQTLEKGTAEYRASNAAALREIAELRGVLGRFAVSTRLERAGIRPEVVDQVQLRIDLQTKKISGSTT